MLLWRCGLLSKNTGAWSLEKPTETINFLSKVMSSSYRIEQKRERQRQRQRERQRETETERQTEFLEKRRPHKRRLCEVILVF